MEYKNNYHELYHSEKTTVQEITPADHFSYILSLCDCRSRQKKEVRKYISHQLKCSVDCLLIDNKININEHRDYLNKINLYVNYSNNKKGQNNDDKICYT